MIWLAWIRLVIFIITTAKYFHGLNGRYSWLCINQGSLCKEIISVKPLSKIELTTFNGQYIFVNWPKGGVSEEPPRSTLQRASTSKSFSAEVETFIHLGVYRWMAMTCFLKLNCQTMQTRHVTFERYHLKNNNIILAINGLVKKGESGNIQCSSHFFVLHFCHILHFSQNENYCGQLK